MAMKTIRIGNGCGFWGDSVDAPIRLAQHGRLDYLTLDYLAELTMSILALQKQRDPHAGYATDFLDVLERLTSVLRDQPSLKIVTNAGGMNPAGCAAKVKEILKKAGLDNGRYAICEIRSSGLFRVSKAANTGGGVNFETVAEQLLYEVGDPAAYLTPDVSADFTSVSLNETETDVVQVSGARGKPTT